LRTTISPSQTAITDSLPLIQSAKGNLRSHFAHSLSHFSRFRKQNDHLLTRFACLLSHFSGSRTRFGIFRKQNGSLLSQTAVCLLISVNHAFITAIAGF
jgi:hypothetical protein